MAAYSTIKERRDYLSVAKTGYRWVTPSFVVQVKPAEGDNAPESLPRFGITATKKVGNAVTRNRAKRRLRELIRLHLSAEANPGWAYVIIARQTDTAVQFDKLIRDGKWAMAKLHARYGV